MLLIAYSSLSLTYPYHISVSHPPLPIIFLIKLSGLAESHQEAEGKRGSSSQSLTWICEAPHPNTYILE